MRKLIAAAVFATLSVATLADDMSYSYVEGGIVQVDIDGAGDGTGFLIGGSIKFADKLFGFVDFRNVNIDVGRGDADVEAASVGLGGRLPLSDKADFIMRFGAVRADAAVGGFRGDDNGYLIGLGLRGRASDVFEMEGGLEYVEIGNGGGETGVKVDGRYFFTPNFSVGLGGTLADKQTDARLIARYSF